MGCAANVQRLELRQGDIVRRVKIEGVVQRGYDFERVALVGYDG